MKNRLTTLDIAYLIEDIRRKLVGLRVDQIYDIDKKTYLIRFAKSGAKIVLLLESGTRFHTTSFEWPKNPAPSGFAMKLRKHLNNKRLEKITQVGADRIVDLQFGIDTFAHHVILELYDKGNILLTDNSYKILNLLRPRVAGEERMAAHETYAVEKAKQTFSLEQGEIVDILKSGVTNKTLRELFMSKVEFGPALFSHVLKAQQLTPQTKIPSFESDDALIEFAGKIHKSFEAGCEILTDKSNVEGFILCATVEESKRKAQQGGAGESKDASDDAPSFYDQFHPAVLVEDYDQEKVVKFDSFDIAVDEFFSKVESQKLDMKQLNQEKDAIRKLEKVKLDQQKRLDELKMGQELDRRKAELITTNLAVVEMAINAIRKLVANQIPWETIDEQIKEAKATGDPLASLISELNLKQNSITILLKDPYEEDEEPVKVSLDLNLSAYANATKYYDLKKASAKKEERTLESQEKAMKSTEKKTMASIKEAQTIHSIKKARKVLWFEKFRWFITSENYLVLGGRDAQQNELLVKKYMRPRDIYLHADAHGAPSIIIKNDNPEDQVPPKTLNEAGGFGVCCSGSWDSKVVSSCWWVWGDQVSKSAPSGEYLPSGSFMIRGKKNYLPPCQLVLGFGFLFRLTEDCIEAHKNERVRRHLNSESESLASMSIHEEEEELEMPDTEEFPDTHVEVDIASAAKGSERYKRLMGLGEGAEATNEEFMVTATPTAVPSLQKLKNKQKKAVKTEKAQGKSKQEAPKPPKPESIDDNQKSNKRGHHGRKKKLKEKYKDQDEEERLLKMQLLRTGAIAVAEGSESRNDSEDAHSDSENETGGESGRNRKPSENQQDKTVPEQNFGGAAAGGDEEVVEIEEEPTAESEIDLLKTLTGSPLEQDELLYAIPVIAPYSTLQNYKFRIKMTPGTAKRGKAAKTALDSFLRDKEATQREKDLIKAVKDQDLARNFPGKVKLSNVIRDKK
ncbi:Nuclear export mediator factor NEMF [Orchesella cincta]|uniref:Nuclear export mediator factor NEMF n=1 Tax=Orchesella cincta TaxID=48709 RepID=A0A1D2NDK0_ORCCI|nr:Nuclear export mediator factor NEMF [Orchesella cincta]